MRLASSIVAAYLAFSCGPCVAADLLAPPQWSASQIRAARPAAPEASLVLDLELSDSVGAAAPSQTEEQVVLAKTFTLERAGGASTLYDHTLCRRLVWRDSQAAFTSDSCYALVAFRVLELENRKRLAALITRLGASAPTASEPYWDEAELGIQGSPDRLSRTETADGTDYRLGDQVVVRLRGNAGAVSAEEMRAFVRELANRFPLHPQVRRDLLASDHLPMSVEMSGMTGGHPRKLLLLVKDLRRTPTAYPLPDGMQAALRQSAGAQDSPRQRGIRAALLAADDPAQAAKPSLEALMSSLAASETAGKPLDALLVFVELSQLYGPLLQTDAGAAARFRSEVGSDLQRALSDPATAAFWTANGLAGDPHAPGDRQAAAAYLAGANLDDHPFGTFRYVTFANLVRSAGDVSKWNPQILKSMPALADGVWLHIARYPWSANAYKDLGDIYLSDFQMTDAWLAYDLGRSADPKWRQSAMGSLSAFEDQLRSSQPDFF